MQLPLEKSSNSTDEAGEPIVDTFLARSHNPPTFLQMLSNLSDSPIRPASRLSDATLAVADPLSVPGDGVTTMAASGGPGATQASVLVDATMDGRDPPAARLHLTRFYPSVQNTSSLVAPVPANLVEPLTPPGMVPDYHVTLVGPIVGIFVHWYPADALPREPHPLVFQRWSTALRCYRQMYSVRQVFLTRNPVVIAAPVAPLAIAGPSSTTEFDHFPPVLPPRTPTGKSNDPILVGSASPTKRLFKATTGPKARKGKQKRTKVDPSSSPPDVPQGKKPTVSRWPDLIIVTDSEDESSAAIALLPAPAVAPSIPPIPPVDATMSHMSSSDHEASGAPRLTTRRRRVPRTGTRTPRRTRREVSPRFTSLPDDMFLSDSPPKNQPTPKATITPVDHLFRSDHEASSISRLTTRRCRVPRTGTYTPSRTRREASPNDMFLCDSPPKKQPTPTPTTAPTQPSTAFDMYDDMFDSDSSDELPLSLFRPTTRAVAPVVAPMVHSNAEPANEPALLQSGFNTPTSTHANRGLLSPVAFSNQPSNLVSNTPSTSRLLSPVHDRPYTPLYFPNSPSLSHTPQGFSPSGPAYRTGVVSHSHLSDLEFDFFLEQALSRPSSR